MSETWDDHREPPAPQRRRFDYVPAAGDGEHAHRAARSHSRLVRWLKIVLPAMALIGVAVFWGTVNFVGGDFADVVAVSGIDVESNSVVMEAPRISGFEGTERSYDVTAETAVQSLNDPKVITFNAIKALLGMDGSGTATLAAVVGVYDGNVNTLALDRGVAIDTSEGYSARFNGALIDLDAGNLSSDQPLEISSPQGSLRANAVEILDRGNRVTFSGGVAVRYQPAGDLMAQPGGAAP